MIRLPGVCAVCRREVVWTGKSWRARSTSGQVGARHVCPSDRPTCGAWMPMALARCARRPGHTTEHRTAFSMANAYRAATGRERVA